MWQVAGPAHAFPQQPGFGPETLIEWDDEVPPNEAPGEVRNLLDWEHLDSWYTPADNFFVVHHYPEPAISAADYRLQISGRVERPRSLTLADLRAAPRHELDFTLECSGNTGLPFFVGGIGNGRWAGTPLAALLRRAGVLKSGREVVFWGADAGEVTIRDDSGVLEGGRTGTVTPDSTNGLDLTITERFARSMSLSEAMAPDNLLCYELNGAPLSAEHGFPVRLIAPGWYGGANVKWLTEIELRDGRYAGWFMARDYVTIREEVCDGKTVWTFATVNRARLKSAPAKVTRRNGSYSVFGAAWGAPVARVEVRIDSGPWQAAKLVRHSSRGHGSRDFAWTFWRFPWGHPAAGQHTVTSRAIDTRGQVQPAPDDPFLASKVTYWESNGQITRHVTIPG